jgi:preprotein translocase subunit SecA
VDHRDSVFDTKVAKEEAVLEEIRSIHETGRPVLVGTASVEESERLSRALGDRPHQVLNARHEEAEAAIIARAGERGAITISTNMAGRGVDIRLGPRVGEMGGLHVIGTNRHESRRIDDQLRGRAGRQGDPGSSRFFVSLEDDVIVRYRGEGVADDVDALQQRAEGDHLDARLFLRKYESVVEGQRQIVQRRRQEILTSASPSESEQEGRERRVRLATIDELWSDYRVAVGEMREGTVWITLGGVEPWADYLARIHAMFQDLERTIEEETAARLAEPETESIDPSARGATWTYLTTDEPFGTMSDRVRRGMVRMMRKALG